MLETGKHVQGDEIANISNAIEVFETEIVDMIAKLRYVDSASSPNYTAGLTDSVAKLNSVIDTLHGVLWLLHSIHEGFMDEAERIEAAMEAHKSDD